MFRGTLIDELIATVERAEDRTEARCEEQSLILTERLTNFYTLAQQEISQLELAGVA